MAGVQRRPGECVARCQVCGVRCQGVCVCGAVEEYRCVAARVVGGWAVEVSGAR